jgi:hypothetical protein
MDLPTEVKILSHRPLIGPIIVMYKRLIQLVVGPYLRNVFEQEHQLVENSINKRLDYAEKRLGELEGLGSDLIKRMDTITSLLSQRLDKLNQESLCIQDELKQLTGQYESLRNSLITLRSQSNK